MSRIVHKQGADWGNFQPSFVAELLRLTVEVWEEFRLPGAVYKETRITALFSKFLEDRIYDDEAKDWAVADETKQYDCQGKEVARTDIRVLPPGKKHREFAFVFECKRLNVQQGGRVKHEASAYVGENGMMCFITGKYASGLREGGMLGYVMDRDVMGAREAVIAFIDQNRGGLRLRSASRYEPCQYLNNKPPHGQTYHELADGRVFTLYHVLVPVQYETA
jgi:hypothetical protein